MSTGVRSVDEQHCELIDRIGALHSACIDGRGREELLKMMHFLGDYAKAHFAHEEKLMDQRRCPSRAANKAAHARFLEQYGELLEAVKRDGVSTKLVVELEHLLSDWLRNHICSIDRRLCECPVGAS